MALVGLWYQFSMFPKNCDLGDYLFFLIFGVWMTALEPDVNIAIYNVHDTYFH